MPRFALFYPELKTPALFRMKTQLLIAVLALFGTIASAQTLTITVTDIRNTDGHIQLKFFKTSQDFEDENAFLAKRFSKASVTNNTLTVTVDLPPGHYAVAMLDDEDDSKEMEYNWIGMPEEGFGFSDYYHTGWSKPTFDDFDFDMPDANKTVVMKVRYI